MEPPARLCCHTKVNNKVSSCSKHMLILCLLMLASYVCLQSDSKAMVKGNTVHDLEQIDIASDLPAVCMCCYTDRCMKIQQHLHKHAVLTFLA